MRERGRTRLLGAVAVVVVLVAGAWVLSWQDDGSNPRPSTTTRATEDGPSLTLPPPDSFFVFDGQSNSLSPDLEHAYPSVVVRDGFPGTPTAVVAIGGTSYPTRTADAPGRVDVHATRRDHAVLFTEGGPADLGEGATAEEIFFERIKVYVEGRRAAGFDAVISMTVPPSTFYSPEMEAERRKLNELLLTRHDEVGIDLVADVAGIESLQDPADTSAYYDGVHLTTRAAYLAGHAVLEAMGAE